MCWPQLKNVARTVGVLAALTALEAGQPDSTALAADKDKEPVKIEFKGWFSNPVFSADGKTLIYVQMESLPQGARTAPTQIVLWDVSKGKESRRFDGSADDSLLGPLALSPDGRRLAISLWNTSVRLWDVESGREVSKVDGSQGAQPLSFTGDGNALGWLRDGDVYLADAATAKQLRHFGKETDGPVTAFAFADGGKTVLTQHWQTTDLGGGGKNRNLQYQISCYAHEAATGKKLRQVGDTVTEARRSLEGTPQRAMYPAADGKTVLLAGDRGNFQVCDLATGKKIKEIEVSWKPQVDDPVRQLAVSANNQVVAVVSARGVISCWDLATGKEVRHIDIGTSTDHVALSPDGKTLAVTHQTPGRVGAVLLIYEL